MKGNGRHPSEMKKNSLSLTTEQSFILIRNHTFPDSPEKQRQPLWNTHGNKEKFLPNKCKTCNKWPGDFNSRLMDWEKDQNKDVDTDINR